MKRILLLVVGTILVLPFLFALVVIAWGALDWEALLKHGLLFVRADIPVRTFLELAIPMPFGALCLWFGLKKKGVKTPTPKGGNEKDPVLKS